MSDASAQPVTGFDTLAEYQLHATGLLTVATREIMLYEHDFSAIGLESAAGATALEAFCLRSAQECALRILLRTPRFVETQAPRLLRLLQRYGHRISVRLVRKGATGGDQPFLLNDVGGYVMRFHHDAFRGKTSPLERETWARLKSGFEDAWASAQAGPTGAPLGL